MHLLTSNNLKKQKLKCILFGMPKNTETQEGLAILGEYLSGHLSVKRLKDLAYRVKIIYLMLTGKNFNEIFIHLLEDYGFDKNKAYYFTSRVFRGGGFTKDYLYLKGFKRIVDFNNNYSLVNLFSGKTSLEYLESINEFITRGIILPPTITPLFLKYNTVQTDIINYIIKSLK